MRDKVLIPQWEKVRLCYMSKYTTEVRFICESKSGLENSKGCDDVDEILNNSWNKIFTTKAEIFDENYRAVICKKILKTLLFKGNLFRNCWYLEVVVKYKIRRNFAIL